MKKVVRLTEADLVRIVKRVIIEQGDNLVGQGDRCMRGNDCADALDMHLGYLKDKYKKIDNGDGRFFYVGINQYGDSIKVLVPKKNDSDLIIIDDGAAGTNRKAAVSRLKTYIQGASSLNSLTDVLVEDESYYLGNEPSNTSTAEKNIAIGLTALDAITTGDYNGILFN